MIRIASMVGARPQIIKSAALSRVFREQYAGSIREEIIHSGQHYDMNLSEIQFREMDLKKPDHFLEVGSQSHARQTAAILRKTEDILKRIKPDCLVVYGDTNTTLGGALAAAKLGIPIAHVEAGLRSFNKAMPEEINRIVCDHISTFLFAPTRTGLDNLVREGFKDQPGKPCSPDHPGVFFTGDVMYDNCLFYLNRDHQAPAILERYGLENRRYFLCTIHRDFNTDNPEKLRAVFDALKELSVIFDALIVLPLHPRTMNALKNNLSDEYTRLITESTSFIILSPLSYPEMLILGKRCDMVLTDSGGVQKESFFLGKPCVVLREETEWNEIIEHKAGILAGADKTRIIQAAGTLFGRKEANYPLVFGNGQAAEKIAGILKDFL